MIKASPLPEIALLRESFEYAPETGRLVWRRRPTHHFRGRQAESAWNTKYAGKDVGLISNRGYLAATLNGARLNVARVCFALGHGKLPPTDVYVDHIDGDTLNNRLSNLRCSSHSENMWNSRRHRDNKSGLPKGVFLYRPTMRFGARLNRYRVQHFIGYFTTAEEAAVALDEARRTLHGQFAKSGEKP